MASGGQVKAPRGEAPLARDCFRVGLGRCRSSRKLFDIETFSFRVSRGKLRSRCSLSCTILPSFLPSCQAKITREVEELFTELRAGKHQVLSFLCIKKKQTPNKSEGLLVISSCRALYMLFFDVLYPRHKWTILHCQRTLEPLRRAIGGTTFIILTKGNKQLPQHLTAFSHLQILE